MVAFVGHADQPAVEAVGPGVIGAGQPFRAAAAAADEPRAAVAADIGEGAHRAALAAYHDDALAEIVDRPPVAGAGDFVRVADDLPGRADHPLHLHREIFGVAIEPAGQAQLRLRRGGDVRLGHAPLWQSGGGLSPLGLSTAVRPATDLECSKSPCFWGASA